MSFTVVIPARYASTRLPGKPLSDIAGKPMVQRVWEQACKSSAQQVVIATDDQRILVVAQDFGAQVCMTLPDHPSGTDRLQQVSAQLKLQEDHIVVNVQGDEPLLPPALIDQVANNLVDNQGASIATLCEPMTSIEDVHNPNMVKVVFDASGSALYFSRASIPWARDSFARDKSKMPEAGSWFRHIGIYAYRAGFLNRYVTWGPAPLEEVEQLEQLRALYNGEKIHVDIASDSVPAGVDTEEDLANVRAVFAGDIHHDDS
jgi:3-deoxy-manno-octulosonate cytidylyltransferase (CMP-KDO synthetase)